MSEIKRRFKPDVRKAQIIEATKQLILDKGLTGATVMRIAQALDISHTTLYYHFKNRREILLETFKSVIDEIVRSFNGDMDDPCAFIHRSAYMIYHQALDNPKLGRLFLELLCAPPEETIYDEAQQQISNLQKIFVAAIEKGIDLGIFRPETDINMVGWQLMSFEITTFLGGMLNLPNFITLDQGIQSVNMVLNSIKAAEAPS